MLGSDAQLVPSGKYRVLGHHRAAVTDLPGCAHPQHLDCCPDQPPGHRVAVGVDRHQPVGGHDTLTRHCGEEPRAPGKGRQGVRLARKALDRRLVGGAVLAPIGDLGLPSRELLVEVRKVVKHAPGQEVALDVLDAGLDLALGLRPVGPAH